MNQIIPKDGEFIVEINFNDLMKRKLSTSETIGRAVAASIQNLIIEKVPEYKKNPSNSYKLKLKGDTVIFETAHL